MKLDIVDFSMAPQPSTDIPPNLHKYALLNSTTKQNLTFLESPGLPDISNDLSNKSSLATKNPYKHSVQLELEDEDTDIEDPQSDEDDSPQIIFDYRNISQYEWLKPFGYSEGDQYFTVSIASVCSTADTGINSAVSMVSLLSILLIRHCELGPELGSGLPET